MNGLPVRSALYMPASRERLLAKAVGLPCDAVILDLEDSVAPDAKALARTAAVTALNEQDYGARLRVLRLNGADSEWHADDVAAVRDGIPDAVLLPKCDDAQALQRLDERLDAAGVPATVRLWAMLETPAALMNLAGFAAVCGDGGRLDTFCIGNNDLASAAHLPPPTDRDTLQPWLMQFVACARANGVSILDGVYNDFADAEGFERDCDASVRSGFDGRTLIHPAQIDAANAAYLPSELAVQQAQRIVELFAQPEHAGVGAVALDGRMVERLHLAQAERTLRLAARRSS